MSVQHPSVGRRQDGSDTHRQILAVAQRLFTTIGYRKTTVADIAAELGMSPANVYRFFESKKAINEGVAELLLDGIARQLEVIAAADTAPPVRVAQFLRALHRLSEDTFLTNQRVNDMVEDAMVESWSVCVAYSLRVREALASIVAEGQASGHFRIEDPSAAAACVMGSMTCFMHPLMMASSVELGRPDINDVAAFALRGLGCADPS